MLVAIAKKTLGVKATLYTFLQVVGLTVFEKTPILEVFEQHNLQETQQADSNQLNLFDF